MGGLSCGFMRNAVVHLCLQQKPHVYLFFFSFRRSAPSRKRLRGRRYAVYERNDGI